MKDVKVGDRVSFNPSDLDITSLTGIVMEVDNCDIISIKIDDHHIKEIKKDQQYYSDYLWDCRGLDPDNKSRFYVITRINLEIIIDDVIEF